VHDIELKGCAPVPLAHYLKALGILRLVAEQTDPEAKGYWKENTFHLISSLDKPALISFFLDKYSPTPLLNPWSGRGGFLEGEDGADSKRAGAKMIQAFQSTGASRFSDYKDIIKILIGNPTIQDLNTSRSRWKKLEKKLKKDNTFQEDQLEKIKAEINEEKKKETQLKTALLHALRSSVPDEMVDWIDSCLVLPGRFEDKPIMSPILGTGGNDGSQDFSINFMQRIDEVVEIENGRPKIFSSKLLMNALFSDVVEGLINKTVGQYNPSAVGGPNATSGFESTSQINPWDFILMIEGTILFSSAAVRRLNSIGRDVLSSPFTVRQSNTGYSSASSKDQKDSRDEIWVPLWNKPICISELKSLMNEGRAQVGSRFAQNGVDFARAVSTLGVDRGISSFQRFGLLQRNGKNYFATPLGRFQVQRQPQVELLSDIDQWLETFRRKASSDKAPASAGRALRQLEETILSLCKERGAKRVQDVLIALGECERTMVKSNKWATDRKNPIKPISALSPPWLKEADDGSPELRLAASLASVSGSYKDNKGRHSIVPIRGQMEPVRTWVKNNHLKVDWNDKAGRDVVWSEGDPIKSMNAVMARRIINAVKSGGGTYPDRGRINTDLGDIADFIEGRVDVQKVADLLWGVILVDWPAVKGHPLKRRDWNDSLFPGAAYGLLKLCFPGGPIVSEIHRKASVGDGVAATQLAIRRLRGSGLSAAMTAFDVSCEQMERIAAALLFPLEEKQLETIASKVLRQIEEKED